MVYTIKTEGRVLPEVYLDGRRNKMGFDYSKGTFYAKKNTKPDYLVANILNTLASAKSHYTIKQLSQELSENYRDIYKAVTKLEKEALLNIDYSEKSRIEVSMPEYVKRELDAFEDWQSGEIEPVLEEKKKSCLSNLEDILSDIKNNKKIEPGEIKLDYDGCIEFESARKIESGGYHCKLEPTLERVYVEPRVKVFKPEFKKQYNKKLKEYYLDLGKEIISRITKFVKDESKNIYLLQVSSLGKDYEVDIDDFEWKGDSSALALEDIVYDNELNESYTKALKILKNLGTSDKDISSNFTLSYKGGMLTLGFSNLMSPHWDKVVSLEISYEPFYNIPKRTIPGDRKARVMVTSAGSMSKELALGKFVDSPMKEKMGFSVKDISNIMSNGELNLKK